MTRLDKCKLAIERGYTYDPETGLIYNKHGKINVPSKSTGYIYISMRFNKKKYNLASHQFAWYLINKECVEQIDHINNVRTDNRICNLRAVTKQQNHFNRINVKGYDFHKNKWRARIKVNNKEIYLGYFNTEDEAHQAYLNAKQIYHVI